MMYLKEIIARLRKATKKFVPPLIDTIIKEYGKRPFLILIGCLLSLRSKDLVTIHVCRTLFNQAKTPEELLAISLPRLKKIIYKTGFYQNKARTLHHISKTLLEKFDGNVPSAEEDLLSMKGIGRKTANLVRGLAFGIPAICVDVHVHRISNRLGIIQTKTPEQTEEALKKIIPKHYWIEWNKLLVMWGQNICVPISPFCSKCAIAPYCKQIGITKSR